MTLLERVLAILILIITLTALIQATQSRAVFWDEVVYHDLSRNHSFTYATLSGPAHEAFRPPLYPWVLSIMPHGTISDQRIVSVSILSLALIILAYAFGMISTLSLIAMLPYAAFLNLTESLQVLLTVLVFLILKQPRPRSVFFLPLLLILAFMTKYTLILLTIPTAYVLIRTWKKDYGRPLLFGIIASSIPLIIWQAWVQPVYPTFIHAALANLQIVNTHTSNPITFLTRLITYTWPFLLLILLSKPTTLLEEASLLTIILIPLTLLIVSSEYHYRYVIPMLIPLAIITQRRLENKHPVIRIILLILILIMSLQHAHTITQKYASTSAYEGNVSLLKPLLPPDTPVYATDLLPLQYTLHRQLIGPPFTGEPVTEDLLREKGVCMAIIRPGESLNGSILLTTPYFTLINLSNCTPHAQHSENGISPIPSSPTLND